MAAFATGLCKLIYDYTQNYFKIQMMNIREVLKKLNHHLSEWDVVDENEEAMDGYLSSVRDLNEMMAFTRKQSTKDKERSVEAEQEKWNTVRHKIIRLLESKSSLLTLTDGDNESESVASTEYSDGEINCGESVATTEYSDRKINCGESVASTEYSDSEINCGESVTSTEYSTAKSTVESGGISDPEELIQI